jgi:sigma-B regulation protein RsbU (phosphoserine phosphatase)
MGRLGLAYLVFLAIWIAMQIFAPQGGWAFAARLGSWIGVAFTGTWLIVRLLRLAARQAIWRLRNRLLVTYLFIAVVPILLVAALAGLGGYSLVSQLAVYLVTSELDRRIESIAAFTDSVVHTDPASRPNAMQRTLDLTYREHYPGIEILLREAGHEIRYPEEATIPAPLPGWQAAKGVMVRNGMFYLWSYARTPSGDVTVTVPLTSEFLGELVPNLGRVDVGESPSNPGGVAAEARKIAAGRPLPRAKSRFDPDVLWLATLPTDDWNHPGNAGEGLFIAVQSRVSAVLGAVFNRSADRYQSTLTNLLILDVVVFVAVEIISLLIGVGMTRTITGAVHRLYEGTQRVIAGDFTHRIEVTGHDQLAELSHSFNRMTENMERLLVVAKEKERLESEIEIAREVQDQLFPREVPQLGTLRLTGVCQPARLVSGDYYDYENVGENQVALAIADVAGKGISAALLMAGLQSSLRTQLQDAAEAAGVATDGHRYANLSTSRLVSNLNRQLYATTSPEKYATFFLGVYNEAASTFTYTNAGHLPPLLVRDGVAEPLDVNGTVVGAFPFAPYEESQVVLQPGDLLVCYTDGVTEPENEYGEMFGEQRLRELLARNADRPEQELIAMVLDAVRHWTASEELQDDMTLLLARRVAAATRHPEGETADSSLAAKL